MSYGKFRPVMLASGVLVGFALAVLTRALEAMA